LNQRKQDSVTPSHTDVDLSYAPTEHGRIPINIGGLNSRHSIDRTSPYITIGSWYP